MKIFGGSGGEGERSRENLEGAGGRGKEYPNISGERGAREKFCSPPLPRGLAGACGAGNFELWTGLWELIQLICSVMLPDN